MFPQDKEEALKIDGFILASSDAQAKLFADYFLKFFLFIGKEEIQNSYKKKPEEFAKMGID